MSDAASSYMSRRKSRFQKWDTEFISIFRGHFDSTRQKDPSSRISEIPSSKHSKRDFRHRLHAEADLAIKYLTQSHLKIADIESVLGYAERSAFHRAFKLWTGVRSGAYRELHIARGIRPVPHGRPATSAN